MEKTVGDVREFALAKHGEQTRKHSGQPYIEHLDNVASILTEHGHDDPQIIAAALLHDTVEKTDTTIEELIEHFGEPIAQLVFWLTDNNEGNSQASILQSAWRLSRAPWNAKLIKLADIIDNGMNIRQHDPGFGPQFLDEKRLALKGMVDTEGSRLQKLPLFQRAVLVTEAVVLGPLNI